MAGGAVLTLEFEEGEDGELVIRKIAQRDWVDEVAGTMDLGGMDTEELIDWLRGPVDLP